MAGHLPIGEMHRSEGGVRPVFSSCGEYLWVEDVIISEMGVETAALEILGFLALTFWEGIELTLCWSRARASCGH